MIVSASRRTDVPALYPDWLRRRLAAGWASVANPFDARQVRRVDLRPAPGGELEALVLWTRDPSPLLADVPGWEVRGVRTLWLATATGYPRVLEPAAPPLERAVAALRALAALVGPERVIWRYDPVLLCPGAGVDAAWHRATFRRLAAALAGATRRCVVSLWDDYARSRRRLAAAGLRLAGGEPAPEVLALLAGLGAEGRRRGIEVVTCCEDLAAAELPAGACIDGGLLARLWGLAPRGRDPGQRPGCRCAPSVDLGAYDTCTHGCLYCYATGPAGRAAARRAAHDPEGERLA